MKNQNNKKLIILISCFSLLVSVSGAYFAYYLPLEIASDRIKEISTPTKSKPKNKLIYDEPKQLNEETKKAVNVVEDGKKIVELPVAGNDYMSVERPNISEILSAEELELNESIQIPSIGLSLNIIQGTNQINMLYGATTMLDGQIMGKGNYALAGHHMPRNDLLFSPLMDVQIGAEVIIKNSDKEFKYKVVSTEVVDYTEGARVLKQSDKPIVTLITCDKPSTTNGRFIVVAELIK